jgi:hypothetical protein
MTLSQAQTVQGPTVRLRLDTRQMTERPDARPVTRSLVVQRGDVTVRCPVQGVATSAVVELSGPTGLTGCVPSAPARGLVRRWHAPSAAARPPTASRSRDGPRRAARGWAAQRKEGLLASRQVPVRTVDGGSRRWSTDRCWSAAASTTSW